ncbi:MAG TPA: hypothetical protein VF062_19385 [Candidatus Limnocylindrales bacterium]
MHGDGAVNESVTPCMYWNPGLRSMLDVDKPSYATGSTTAFTVTGTPPNAPITWTATLNDVPTTALSGCLGTSASGA